MKKLITIALLSTLSFFASGQCNTQINFTDVPTTWDWKFCVAVTAPKLSDNLFPAIMDVIYVNVNNQPDTTWSNGGWALNPDNPIARCYSPTTNNSESYFFYNIAQSSPITARTINFVIDRNNPASPYYYKTNAQIYQMIRNDASKWCVSNTLNVNWSGSAVTPQRGKKKFGK